MVRILLVLIFIMVSTHAEARVYDILEPDFVETAKAFARTEEFKKEVIKERDRQVEQIKAAQGERLPVSDRDYSYKVNYYYTLTQDIPKVDKAGNIVGILYPKGYVFEPLKYMVNQPSPLIIYNPCIKEELEFVNNMRKVFDKNYKRYILITSGCSMEEISKLNINYPTYLLDKDSIEKFNLKHTVSVVNANLKEGVFDVTVYSTNKKKQQ